MKPGPDSIFKCPTCNQLLKNGSQRSGNTFGAKFFSDGYMSARMFTHYPNIIKCPSCSEMFWLYDSMIICKYDWESKMSNISNKRIGWRTIIRPFATYLLNSKYNFIEKRNRISYSKEGKRDRIKDTDKKKMYENAKHVPKLDFKDYQTAIENKIFNVKDEEIYLRHRILWGFNGRSNLGDKSTFSFWINVDSFEFESPLREENSQRLLELLDVNNINQKILMAELYRNSGDFKKCTEIMESIEDTDYEWIKNAFKKECNKGNRSVFELKESI